MLVALLSCGGLHVSYPSVARGDVVDDFFGTQVPDPYRWLETGGSEVEAFVAAQNALTRQILDGVPGREATRARLEELVDHERFGLPKRRGERTFFTRNDGLQPQAPLFVEEGGLTRMLFDPADLSADNKDALVSWTPSPSGALVLCEISVGGSDWRRLQVLDVSTGAWLEDRVDRVKFSALSWRGDEAFFYTSYPGVPAGQELEAVSVGPTLHEHRLGDRQVDDRVVMSDPHHPERGFNAWVTGDGALFVHVWRGTGRSVEIHYADPIESVPRPLRTGFDAEYLLLGSQDGQLYLRTTLEADRGRVVRLDPETREIVEVVAEQEAILDGGELIGGQLVLRFSEHAVHRVEIRDLDGALVHTVALPGVGTVAGLRGTEHDPSTFFSFSSFLSPPTIYTLDVASGSADVFQAPEVPFDGERYVVEQVFYPSSDGAQVPMFLVRRGDLEPTGDHPTLLYGYGGFGLALHSEWKADVAAWLELGGVYAQPGLRGGGEYGEAWHQAGAKLHKQQVFDDFIAAGEWLVAQGWTRPDRLAIHGRSNGGLLVGACMNQRPDLFGAVLGGVGVMDMLRYHRFTIGWAWASDYGRPDDSELFPTLYGYSPVHNVQPGTRYPATLLYTGDHDDRVVPAHSYKFAAALQHAQAGPAPILLRVETRAGHKVGKSVQVWIDEVADWYAFLDLALDMP